MNLLVVFIIGMILSIIFIWHSKLYFHIAYSRVYSKNTVDIAVLLFDYITIYHKKIYILDKDVLKKILLKRVQEKKVNVHMKIKLYVNKNIFFNPLIDFKKISIALKKINLRYLRCEKFSYYINIGMFNPAATAMLYGMFFTFKGLILQYLYKNLMFVATPEGLIKPEFTAKKEEVQINCIFSLKIGNVIYMLRSLL